MNKRQEARLGCHLMLSNRVSCSEGLYLKRCRNTWDPDKDEKLVHLARGCNTFDEENIKETPTDVLCKLLQLQATPEVDMEQFDGNPVNYHYFMALFAEVVETKIEKARGRLTRLTKFSTGDTTELIKYCIQLPHNRVYQHAKAFLE